MLTRGATAPTCRRGMTSRPALVTWKETSLAVRILRTSTLTSGSAAAAERKGGGGETGGESGRAAV